MNAGQFADAILRGTGQVMLQDNRWTGLLFLAGIAVCDVSLAWWALLGNAVGICTAIALRYEEKDIQAGLYGFNATLVGIAARTSFGFNAATAAGLVAFSALSAVIMREMAKRGWRPLTFPFVASAWAMIALFQAFNLAQATHSDIWVPGFPDAIFAGLYGVSQVMLIANAGTGILFLAGLAASSAFVAGCGFLGGLIGGALGLAAGFPAGSVNLGLYGFNAVLAGIALTDNSKSAKFTLLAIALSVAIMHAFLLLGLPALTAPFVFAAWIALEARKRLSARNGNPAPGR